MYLRGLDGASLLNFKRVFFPTKATSGIKPDIRMITAVQGDLEEIIRRSY